MFARYKKLIYSQICSVLGVIAVIMAMLRYAQVGDMIEQMTLSFILFAVVLFAIEVRLIIGWLKDRKTQ